MKNKVFLILLAAVFAISLNIVGCGEVTPLPPEISLVFSDHNPPFNACAQALTTYANYIADHSDGKIEITKIGYGGEILPQLAAFEGVQAGTADCASYVPEIGDGLEYIQVMNLPFMGWGTPRKAEAVYGKLIDDYSEILGQFPSTLTFTTLNMMPPVHLHYYAEDFVADTPDDIAGKEIICMEGNVANILDMLGVVPALLSFPDVLDQVPKGFGDGFSQHSEFCFGLGLISNFHSHTFFPGGIMMIPIGALWNTESYEAVLDIVGQDVMDAAAAAWLTKFIEATAVDTAGALGWIAEHGDTVTSLTAEQTAVWAAAVADYVTAWENSCDNPALAAAIYAAAVGYIAAP